MNFPGLGIIKGMAVTAENFLRSFSRADRLFTTEYPEERIALQENYRNFPFLVYDDAPENMRCVACKICEKECPPQCISIEEDRDEKGKVIRRPKVFDIDYSVCMGCQICVEVCPFDAIKMDHEYELSTDNRFDGLLFHRDELLKPADQYEKMHPTEGAIVNAKIREQIEKKKKAEAAKAAAAAQKPAPVAEK